MKFNRLSNTIQFFDQHQYFAGCVEVNDQDLNGNVHLSGWAINCFVMDLPDLIIIKSNGGNIIATAECSLPRPDVVSLFNNIKLLNSGWDIIIPKEQIDISHLEDTKIFAYYKKEKSAYLIRNVTVQNDLETKKIEEELWLKATGQMPPDRSNPYYSCMYIEGAIIFSGDHQLNLCCILNLNSPDPNDAIMLGSSDPDRFSIKKILEKRKDIILANQNEGYPTCRGCFLLRKKIWPYRKNLFNYLNLIHSTDCNLTCKFCRRSNVGTPTQEVLNCINILSSEKYLADDSNVAISGGEPALMRGLDDLLTLLGKYKVSLSSNGTIFSDSIATALRNGKLNDLIISADAVDPKIYTLIKGKDLSGQVWENIRKYAVISQSKVIPKMIIMEENIEDIELFIQQCVRCGVTSAMYDYDQFNKPNEKIIKALRQFEKSCKYYGIIGIPARSEIISLLANPDICEH